MKFHQNGRRTQFDWNIHYANRRSKRDDMEAYLMQKTDLPKTIFND